MVDGPELGPPAPEKRKGLSADLFTWNLRCTPKENHHILGEEGDRETESITLRMQCPLGRGAQRGIFGSQTASLDLLTSLLLEELCVEAGSFRSGTLLDKKLGLTVVVKDMEKKHRCYDSALPFT